MDVDRTMHVHACFFRSRGALRFAAALRAARSFKRSSREERRGILLVVRKFLVETALYI